MDQKKNLLAGASAFGISVAVGLIVGLPLIDKAEPVTKTEAPVVEKAVADVKEAKAEAVEEVKEAQAEATEEVKEAKAEAAEEVKEAKAEAAEEEKEAKAEAAEEVKEAKAEAAEEEKEAKAEAAEEVKEAKAEAVEEVKEAKAEAAEEVKEAKAEAAEEEKEAKAEAAEEVKEAKAEAAEEVKEAKAEAAEDVKEAKAEAHAAPATEHKADNKAHKVFWGYSGKTGPAHWGDLIAKFEMCKLGKMQSPIDLSVENPEIKNVKVETKYKPVELEILNNGHTVQFNVNNGSELITDGKAYQLLQVHYHTPSEHVVDGKPYPMEAHFVHKADDGELAVLGVLYEVGKKDRNLEIVVDHIPMLPADAAKQGVKINPTSLLPKNMGVVRYMGSLTTPPCSEGVKWHVAHKVQSASLAQIAKMHKAMGDNARPAQAINDRLIIKPE